MWPWGGWGKRSGGVKCRRVSTVVVNVPYDIFQLFGLYAKCREGCGFTSGQYT